MLAIGRLQIESPLLLAPVAGYCDLAFRLVVRSVRGEHGGVGLACTDLLSPYSLLKPSAKTPGLTATCLQDHPLAMQLYGREPALLAEAARWAVGHGADVVDINMGCPADKVTKNNGGAKLLCDPALAVRITREVVRAVEPLPVTVKIRLGWDDASVIVESLPGALADCGIAALIVHGRSAEQRFRGTVNLAGIARVVELLARLHPGLPVIGNGDVRSPADARRMIDATGCAGVMIGRGALGQPWIFRDTAHYLATGNLPPPLPLPTRARLVLGHFENLVRFRGERLALAVIRPRMSWYSPHLQPWPNLKRDVQNIRTAAAFRGFMSAAIEAREPSQPVARLTSGG